MEEILDKWKRVRWGYQDLLEKGETISVFGTAFIELYDALAEEQRKVEERKRQIKG